MADAPPVTLTPGEGGRAALHDEVPTFRTVQPQTRDALFGVLVLIGATSIGIGSFGTWQSENIDVVQTYTLTTRGIEGRSGFGWITLALSLILGVAAVVGMATGKRDPKVVAVSMASTAVITCGWFVRLFGFGYQGSFSPGHFRELVGWGLWLCLLGSCLATLSGLLWLRRDRDMRLRL